MAQWRKGRQGNGNVFHRQVKLTSVGSAGTAAAAKYVHTGPAKLTHVKVNFDAATAATADFLIRVDPTDFTAGTGGYTALTCTDTTTDIDIRALGQPSATDEARNATAATDATDGGVFIRGGVHISTAQNDAVTDVVIVDLWFERLRFEEVTLISQSGADGSGIVTRTLPCQGAGRLVGLAIDFQNMPATTDLLIKADSTDGETLFDSTSSATDIGTAQGRSLGIIGIDEANGAMAATDGSTGGAPFRTGLFFDVAQADAFTSGNEKIVIGCWITQ